MAKAISNEIRKQALELFKKGMRSRAVAQILAIDRTVVREWLSAFDRGDYSWTSNEIRKQALELFKKGMRSRAVAQILAIDRTVVREWLSAFDRGDYSWTTYVRRKSSEAIALTAVDLYTELKSYNAVARQLGGMKPSTVRRYVLNVEKYGIPILPQGRDSKAKLQALTQGDSLMSKRKTKPRSRSMNAIKKERDEYKIALECLLESIKAKLQALTQGDSLMSKRKTKPRSRSMNAIKKERDEYKIALECLLESIQEKFEDDDEGQKKKFDS